MPNTYSQIYIHAVFAVKYREATIHKDWKHDLNATIGQIINSEGAKTIIVNGVEDHMHCFFTMRPSVSLSELMKNAIAKSSKWVNEYVGLNERFEWQVGFGAFSYSKSQVNKVFQYILNQERHHKNQLFKDEYRMLLKKFDVEFEEQYLFDDLM